MASRSRSAGDQPPARARPAKSRPANPRSATPRLLQGATVGVIGVGQIGGSIVRRLSRLRPGLALCAFDRDTSLSAKIRRFGRWCRTLEELVGQSDIVILAVPTQTAVGLMPRIARLTTERRRRRRLMVCDLSTVKATVLAAAAPHSATFDFVALHPLAGTEGQGWESADAALFDGRRIVICPSPARAGRIARELIDLLGATPVKMTARDHDGFAAEGIGLPHMLAFAASGLDAGGRAGQLLKGGSWRSLTRVAASNPTMVAGFLHENRENQLRALNRFLGQLHTLTRALCLPTSRGLERQLEARQRRARKTGGGTR